MHCTHSTCSVRRSAAATPYQARSRPAERVPKKLSGARIPTAQADCARRTLPTVCSTRTSSVRIRRCCAVVRLVAVAEERTRAPHSCVGPQTKRSKRIDTTSCVTLSLGGVPRNSRSRHSTTLPTAAAADTFAAHPRDNGARFSHPTLRRLLAELGIDGCRLRCRRRRCRLAGLLAVRCTPYSSNRSCSISHRAVIFRSVECRDSVGAAIARDVCSMCRVSRLKKCIVYSLIEFS